MIPRKSVVLFDPFMGGHHLLYLQRFAAALCSSFAVTVAAPAPTDGVWGMGDMPVDILPLTAHTMQRSPVLSRERRVMAELIDRIQPDHLVHMYADPFLPELTFMPRMKALISLLLFRPRAHYPSQFGTRLGWPQLIHGRAYEVLLSRWRHRPDACTAFTLDEYAAASWSRQAGAHAVWLPEPAVLCATEPRSDPTAGPLIYGSLSGRKGIEYVAAALMEQGAPSTLTVAGRPVASYTEELNRILQGLTERGIRVDARLWHITDDEAFNLMREASCVVVAYPHHIGMSRVLLEAAAAGAPIVANSFGLMGHLVRQHRLGLVVDCTDSRALAHAMTSVAGLRTDSSTLEAFVGRYSAGAFEAALREALATPKRSEQDRRGESRASGPHR